MKRIGLAGALAVAIAAPAVAGGYHRGLTLRCSECHIMHYSQQHGYQPSGGGPWPDRWPGPRD